MAFLCNTRSRTDYIILHYTKEVTPTHESPVGSFIET